MMTNTYHHSDSGASSFVSTNIHTYTVITASASNTCLFECLLQAVPKTHQHHRGIWTRATAVNLYLMSCAVLSTAKREYLLILTADFSFPQLSFLLWSFFATVHHSFTDPACKIDGNLGKFKFINLRHLLRIKISWRVLTSPNLSLFSICSVFFSLRK